MAKKVCILRIGLFAFLVTLVPLLHSQLTKSNSRPVATINGSAISEGELHLGTKLIQLQQQAYQLRLEALEELIAERLLEAEAAKNNISAEAFLEREVHRKVSEPTDQEVEAFYERQKSRIRQPLEDVRDQLRDMMRSAQLQQAKQDYIDELRKANDVKILLEPPRIPVEIGDAPRRGPADAPVTIVEFSDFQCPYCRRVQPTLEAVREKYGGQVRFVYKDLPLKQIHSEAQQAAEAAHCAGDQGKYWEYHEALFERERITADAFPKIASALELDPIQFQQCLDAKKYQADVDGDLEQALAVGANSTPTFFVNGIQLRGAQPLSAFTQIIDAELAAAQDKGQR